MCRKPENQIDYVMVAQCHLKLGELGLEIENYPQAVGDFQECLAIHQVSFAYVTIIVHCSKRQCLLVPVFTCFIRNTCLILIASWPKRITTWAWPTVLIGSMILLWSSTEWPLTFWKKGSVMLFSLYLPKIV